MDILRQTNRITRSQQLGWFGNLKKDRTQRLFFIFENNDSGKIPVGYCGLTNIDAVNRRAEISFLVDTKRVGEVSLYRTDMLNALSFLADYAFKSLRLKKIFTETFEFRKKHISILEFFGFKKEGVLRLHILLKGRYYNSSIHSMLREEYTRKFKRRQR